VYSASGEGSDMATERAFVVASTRHRSEGVFSRLVT
jgi:hypothetical protein